MDLKQLRTFICLAEAGSLSRASDRLRIAQPALSRHIKLLEHELGVELFTRHVRGMDLTGPGKELLSRVSGLIRQLEQSIHDVRSIQGEVSGNVALGLTPTITAVVAQRLVQRVARELPDVTLRLVEGYSVHLIEWLQRGDIDMSFLYGPSSDFHLRTIDLLIEDIVLISPPGQLPDPAEPISLACALSQPLALPSRPYGVRLAVDTAAKKAGLAVDIAYEVDSFFVIKALVRSGDFHGFMPISSVADELAAGQIEARQIANHQPRRQVILGMPSDRSDTRATGAVIEILKNEMRDLVETGKWPARLASDLLIPA